jgi:hypothetical protein
LESYHLVGNSLSKKIITNNLKNDKEIKTWRK